MPPWLSEIINRLKQYRSNPKVSKALGVLSVIYPLVLMFFSWEELLSIDWSSFIWVLLGSLLVYYFSMSLQNINWSLIVEGNLTKFLINSQVYYQTILMKRLPGGVWHWLGRASIYETSYPDENRSISKSNFIEWIALILSGFVGYLFIKNPLIGVLSAVVTIGITAWLLDKDLQNLPKTLLTAIVIFFFYLLCWLAGALILHWLLNGLATEPISFSTSFSTWCLSSVISMLFFFIPSGSIIRDFSLGALLATQLEPAKSLLVILQIRVIFLISDFLWSFLSLQIIKLFSKEPKAN